MRRPGPGPRRSGPSCPSGRRRGRALWALLVLRPGDQLVVTKLDRLGRSLEHRIALSKQLQERNVDLVVLDQGIDTSTAVGRRRDRANGATPSSRSPASSASPAPLSTATSPRPDHRSLVTCVNVNACTS
ncbi:recombinase family protein [Nonomuraea polychroma]|uniref:recombinase family protein n=1 Tax=Nonomuraea polychroma TaxID=46176 RepID=UPI003D8E032C